MRYIFLIRLSLVSLLMAILLIASGPNASAQQIGPAVTIAVVDAQKILEECKASKTVQSALEKQRTSYQNDISQQENALRTADQDLSRQRPSRAPKITRRNGRSWNRKRPLFAATYRRNGSSSTVCSRPA